LKIAVFEHMIPSSLVEVLLYF